MAGHADNGLGQQRAGVRVSCVFLTDMDAVAAQFGGEVGPVIEDKRGARALHDGPQDVGGAADLVVAGLFQAQLERGDVAAQKRLLQHAREIGGRDARRRDQIQAAIGHGRVIAKK